MQLKKAWLQTVLILGIITFFKFEQFENANQPISSTKGIKTSVRDLHPEKALNFKYFALDKTILFAGNLNRSYWLGSIASSLSTTAYPGFTASLVDALSGFFSSSTSPEAKTENGAKATIPNDKTHEINAFLKLKFIFYSPI